MKTIATFNTRSFYTAHLRQPSGRGVWFFNCDGIAFCTRSNTTYAEAKKQAVEFFSQQFPTKTYLVIHVQA